MSQQSLTDLAAAMLGSDADRCEMRGFRAMPSRWWLALALIGTVAVVIPAVRSWMGPDDAPRHGNVWEQLRGFMGGKSARVGVLVEHGLEDGSLEVSEHGVVLLSDSLKAPQKELFGASFLAYRSGIDTSTFRLNPGSHVLTVKVTARDGLELVKTLDVQIESKSEYDLHISVSTWPRKRMSADWDLVEK